MARRVFGQGLNDILNATKLSAEDAVHQGIHREFKTLSLNAIIPGKYQPRKDFEPNSLQELADSIKAQGILQPLIVRKYNNEHEIIAGERRWRAAKLAGLNEIPVIVCEVTNDSVLAYSLIENIQRQDLNPIEEATALKRLLEEFAMTHEEVAQAIGRSRTMVTNMLRLLNLAATVKSMLVSKQLEMGHARALLSLSHEQQTTVAEVIINKQMTVRAAEEYVKRIQQPGCIVQKTSEENLRILNLEKELYQILGVSTKIQINSEGKGRMIHYFPDFKRLESLISKLRNIG